MDFVYQCPKCGKEMLQGSLLAGFGRKLLWYSRHCSYSVKDDFKLLFNYGDPNRVMLLHRHAQEARYLPALNCPECKLVLLDYEEDHAKNYN